MPDSQLTSTTDPASAPVSRSAAAAKPAKRRKLKAATVPVKGLPREVVDEAWQLMEANYERADRGRFEADMREKQRIILLREPGSGKLMGFSTMHDQVVDTPKGKAVVVFSGDTTIDRAYWGEKALNREFCRQLLLMKLRNPRKKVLWFLISKGYKSYLLLAHAFPKATPRYDNPNPPEWLTDVLRDAALRRFADQYNPDTGVITYSEQREVVRGGLAPLTDAERAYPHIAFFERHNPGHADGQELACMAELRIRDLVPVIVRVTLKKLGLPVSYR